MSQGFQVGWLKSVGIVPVLFGMGFFLCYSQIMVWFGWVLVISSGLIGIIYGLLGVIGILDRMNIIEIKTTSFSLESLLHIFKRKG